MPGYANVTAYILAGGFGTRLGQVVADRLNRHCLNCHTYCY